MKKLINLLFAGKSVNTSEGKLTFDDKGICILEDEVADVFKNVKGFVVENDAENNDDIDDEKDSDKIENTSENNDNDDKKDLEDVDDTSDDIDLNSLSVPSLKKYAKEQGIDINGLTTKEPLIKAIKEATQK